MVTMHTSDIFLVARSCPLTSQQQRSWLSHTRKGESRSVVLSQSTNIPVPRSIRVVGYVGRRSLGKNLQLFRQDLHLLRDPAE